MLVRKLGQGAAYNEVEMGYNIISIHGYLY